MPRFTFLVTVEVDPRVQTEYPPERLHAMFEDTFQFWQDNLAFIPGSKETGVSVTVGETPTRNP